MIKNILLTGSGGFIGFNLKQELEQRYTVFAPRSAELDLSSKQAVQDYFQGKDIDFIIHCASVGGARGQADQPDTIAKNVAMVNNLAAAKSPDTKMIVFGSGAGYDKSRPLCKVKESELLSSHPKDLYGISKQEIAKIVLGREDMLMLIIFACYGAGEKAGRFPSYAIGQAIKGQEITINQNVIFDYLYIEDLIKIVLFFMDNPSQDKIINATPTASISLTEIADIVNSFLPAPVNVNILSDTMNNAYTGDNSLLLNHIKGFKFTEYKTGLQALYKKQIKERLC